ncbi:chorismate-binding protein [Desulfohalovibrio reitneri]|uniref:chorismate-binding protein n=1 Tax=Desulfohalovibrio reitneri TaxID=1307759 RepID=UPI00068D1154|nr:chorismate-binding protein [Desulfohalovibrio reitneri]
MEASLDREAYENVVRRALRYILDGHAYQLTLSIRYGARGRADPLDLVRRLFLRHPAAHYALFHTDSKAVISASPERFLRVRDGDILSQPIKGTARVPQGGDPHRMAERLMASDKESAELSMIVDLVRNDVSANADYGTVKVRGHKNVFLVDDLLQMRSDVTARLRSDRTALHLLHDAFPGGSVTGCPKRRAMEIMEELEPHTRGVYCGTLFMAFGPRDLDSSIAIRTAVLDQASGDFTFHAGSGIVVDSDPSREFEETTAKADKFLNLVERGGFGEGTP